MKLKIKFLKWSAGLPVAILNKKTAEKIGVHPRDRIFIKPFSGNSEKISSGVDIVEKLVREDEVGVSSEIRKRMGLKRGQKVNISLAQSPRSLEFIKKKLNKKRLSEKEIGEIIRDIVNNSLSEPEIALFVSSVYRHGMSMKETVYLTKAILKSGRMLRLNERLVVDKHSIGGIPGNRTTPLVVSICAAAGLIIPKNSSRAITSAAGTADVIETVARVDFSIEEIKKIIGKTNACMVWGGALGMVPADSRIIQIEKMLGVDPEAQLLASIMSKKLAVGSKYILIDIPYGKNAKVTKARALRLKRKFEKMGDYFNKKLKVVLTDGSQPIGNGVGPALEMADVINILDPQKQGPKDLEEKSLFLAGELLELTKKAKKGEGIKIAREILYSGMAFKKFKQIIKAQKGSLKNLKSFNPTGFKKDIFSKEYGEVEEIDNKKINSLARVAGGPADKYAGVYLYLHVGDKVKRGDKIVTLYAESRSRLRQALRFYKEQKPVKIK